MSWNHLNDVSPESKSEIVPCVCTSGPRRKLLREKERETNRFYSNFHPVPPVFVNTILTAVPKPPSKNPERLCLMNKVTEGRKTRHWFTHLTKTVRTSCFHLRPLGRERNEGPNRCQRVPSISRVHYKSHKSAFSPNNTQIGSQVMVFDGSVCAPCVRSGLALSAAQIYGPAGAHPKIPANRSGWHPRTTSKSRSPQPAQCEELQSIMVCIRATRLWKIS